MSRDFYAGLLVGIGLTVVAAMLAFIWWLNHNGSRARKVEMSDARDRIEKKIASFPKGTKVITLHSEYATPQAYAIRGYKLDDPSGFLTLVMLDGETQSVRTSLLTGWHCVVSKGGEDDDTGTDDAGTTG